MEKKTSLDIIATINDFGLNKTDFRTSSNKEFFCLEYKDSGLMFRFHYNPIELDQFTYSKTSYTRNRQSTSDHSVFLSVDSVIKFFKKWLANDVGKFIEEENLPNPWTIDTDPNNTFSSIKETDSTRFDKVSSLEIKTAINQFESQLLQTFKLEGEKLESIKSELKYLSESVDRLNKRDFKAVGRRIIYDIGIEIAASLSVDISKNILLSEIPPLFWSIVRQCFIVIFNGLTE
jgi:hypothetical protein